MWVAGKGSGTITQPFVILNLFQDNKPPLPVILKRVQDDEILGRTLNISNTRNKFSYKTGAQLYDTEKGTADAEALVLLPADGVCGLRLDCSIRLVPGAAFILAVTLPWG